MVKCKIIPTLASLKRIQLNEKKFYQFLSYDIQIEELFFLNIINYLQESQELLKKIKDQNLKVLIRISSKMTSEINKMNILVDLFKDQYGYIVLEFIEPDFINLIKYYKEHIDILNKLNCQFAIIKKLNENFKIINYINNYKIYCIVIDKYYVSNMNEKHNFFIDFISHLQIKEINLLFEINSIKSLNIHKYYYLEDKKYNSKELLEMLGEKPTHL